VGHFDAEVVAEAYVTWLESEPFDAGATVTQACRAGRGAPPGGRAEAMRAAASPTSQANGALMRLSTLAVHLAFASDAVRDAAVRADTELTHPHPACVGASLVFDEVSHVHCEWKNGVDTTAAGGGDRAAAAERAARQAIDSKVGPLRHCLLRTA
jgi:ADP-ribosylglycohydrolase